MLNMCFEFVESESCVLLKEWLLIFAPCEGQVFLLPVILKNETIRQKFLIAIAILHVKAFIKK